MDAALRPLDPALRAFAGRHGIDLVENDRGWPSRTLRWESDGIERAVDVYLEDESSGAVAVRAAAWIDHGEDRLGRSESIRERVDPAVLADGFDEVLEAGRRSAEAWERSDLEPWDDLETAGPGWRTIVSVWIPFLLLGAIVVWLVDWLLESALG